MAQALTLAAFLLVAGLLLLANYGEDHPGARSLSFFLTALLAGSALAVTAVASLYSLLPFWLGRLSPERFRAIESFDLPVALAGGFGLLYLHPMVQRAVARVLPVRPGSPVHYTALVLGLLYLGVQLGFELSVDVLSLFVNAPPITVTDLLVEEIPLLVLALIGVGLFIRRSLPESLGRLGLKLPRPEWWAVALVAIAIFYAIGFGIDRAADVLTPGTQQRVSDVTAVLYRRFNNPAAIFLLGIAAGTGEEIFFRGALLPRFGVVLTALLFAGVHTQYGITLASLQVFILGLLLGWLRLRAGTLPCIVTHAGYDITVGLLGLGH